MNLSNYTKEQLMQAEHYAVKYTPSFALLIAKEWFKREIER